jgi:CheY-like chemotaxis protein
VLGREDKAPGKTTPLVTRHSIEENRRGRGRVLLAEDSPINRKVVLALLAKLNCHADAVTSGRQALQALESTAYDLVLMDCQMPDMDGYEATRQIRNSHSHVRNHAVPIVAVTAHAIKGDREKCLEAGMDGYLAKPISLASLAETIDKFCH